MHPKQDFLPLYHLHLASRQAGRGRRAFFLAAGLLALLAAALAVALVARGGGL